VAAPLHRVAPVGARDGQRDAVNRFTSVKHKKKQEVWRKVMSGRYRVIIAILLFLVGMINYMDRAAIGILAPHIRGDLGLSTSQLGVIFSAFFLGYAIFSFLGGYLSDRFGPLKTFTVAAAAWSVFCGLTGLATNFVFLLIVRVFFGASEGPMGSTTNRMITNWFPKKETARAVGFTFSGQNFGSAVAAPIVVFSALWLGWRLAFAVLAGLGVVWCLVWIWLAKDKPEQSRHTTEAECSYIVSDRKQDNQSDEALPPLREYLRRPSTIALGIGLFSMNYSLYIFVSWLPSYLTSVLHVTQHQLAGFAMVPWVGGFIGYLGGGFVSDLVYRGASDKLKARKITSGVPLFIAGIALMSLIVVKDLWITVGVFSLSLMMLSMAMQSLWSTIHEVVPTARIGGVSGFIHFLANTSGIISPAITGYVVENFGGYNSAFVIASVVAFSGCISIAGFVRRHRPASGIEGGVPVGHLSSAAKG